MNIFNTRFKAKIDVAQLSNVANRCRVELCKAKFINWQGKITLKKEEG
jgi:hypothetical protein